MEGATEPEVLDAESLPPELLAQLQKEIAGAKARPAKAGFARAQSRAQKRAQARNLKDTAQQRNLIHRQHGLDARERFGYESKKRHEAIEAAKQEKSDG